MKVFNVIALFLVISGFFSDVSACAMITHGEVSHRASFFLDPVEHPYYHLIVNNNSGALEAGAAFPDWGYSTGYSNESEEAHWDPFIRVAADYIHETYGPPPWESDVEKLVVFLLGIMSHSMADLSWHDLYEGGLPGGYGVFRDGFLEAMAEQNFNGNFGESHDQEVAGDFIIARSHDTDWYGESWHIPSSDLEEIYKRRGFDISAMTIWLNAKVVLGAASEFLNFGGEKIELTYASYADKSPFLIEQFQDYFVGGLDEMAVSTYWRWLEVFDWLENGVPDNLKPLKFDGFSYRQPEEIGLHFYNDLLGMGFNQKKKEIKRSPGFTKSFPDFLSQRMINVSMETPYSYFGTGLAGGDLDGDGRSELIIGAPGYSDPGSPAIGAVYILKGFNAPGNKNITAGDADIIIKGAEESARFGWSVTAVDINADGLDDLCIGAPNSGAAQRKYSGQIFIYFGNEDLIFNEPDIVISTDELNGNIGYFLSSGDINGDGYNDLLAGSPFYGGGGRQRGIAAVFTSSQTKVTGQNLIIDDADWIKTGDSNFDWFGHSVAVNNESGSSLVVVGAPGTEIDGKQSCGKVYGYDLESEEPQFVINGDGEFDQTGSYLSIGKPYGPGETFLIVSAASGSQNKRYSGTVFALQLSDLSGNNNVTEVSVASINGDSKYNRFGWSTVLTDSNGDGIDDLWVGEPFLAGNSGVEAGAVRYWEGGFSFPRGEVNDPSASANVSATYLTHKSRLGSSVSALDFNGDGCMDIAVSARQNSTNARFAGDVHLIISEFCEYVEDPDPVDDGDNENDTDMPEEVEDDPEESDDDLLETDSEQKADEAVVSDIETNDEDALEGPPKKSKGCSTLII